MPFSFPASPTVGQQSTQNGRVYQWTSAGVWELVATPTAIDGAAITSGTIDAARLPSSGVSASSLTVGTVDAARLPLATTAQALAGTNSATVLTPAAAHLSRRGSGRAWFWEAFTDFAFDISGQNTGTDGLIFGAGSTGAGSNAEIFSNTPDGFTTRPSAGILTMSTGTTNAGRGGITSFQSRPVASRNGPIYVEVLASVPTLATATEDYVVRVGSIRNDGLAQWPLLAFEYDRANSANWRGVHIDNSNNTPTRVDLGVAVTAGQWVKLAILYTTTLARFFINDTEVGSLTLNTPNSMWLGGHIIKTAGTTSRTFLLDYFYVRQDFTTARTNS